jgi:hypothetical protein
VKGVRGEKDARERAEGKRSYLTGEVMNGVFLV